MDEMIIKIEKIREMTENAWKYLIFCEMNNGFSHPLTLRARTKWAALQDAYEVLTGKLA